MTVSVIGIDPGNEGAIVRLTASPCLMIEYTLLKRLSPEPAQLCLQVAELFGRWRKQGLIASVGLEEPFAFEGQGHMLPYFRKFGRLETAVALTRADVTLWNPSQWQPRIIGGPRQNGLSSTGKERARYVFEQLFRLPPELSQHSGVVDAALIAVVEAMRVRLIEPVNINWSGFTPSVKGDPANDKRKPATKRKPRAGRTPSEAH